MRVFAISDLHIDFEENRQWLHQLSRYDYQQDILIVAGDVTDLVPLLNEGFEALKARFQKVFYVPGNHDLWVRRNHGDNSFEHFQRLKTIAKDYGIQMQPAHLGSLSIVPLLGWYDYSFGQPSNTLLHTWADYSTCKWPENIDETGVTQYFLAQNDPFLTINNQCIISFSHFLPRIDLMPVFISSDRKMLYPVFGSARLEKQIRQLGSTIHIYGHSHVNRCILKDGTTYINNALGYPSEMYITSRELRCVFEL